MRETAANSEWRHHVREAVGVFATPEDLDAAVTELEGSGFDRAGISVLGPREEAQARTGHLYSRVSEIEDDAEAPHAAHVPEASRAEGLAVVIGFPFYVGGLAGAIAVAAAGGALATAIAATLVTGAAGAGLGGLLARAMARRHVREVEAQLSQGGLVLWVNVPDAATEQRALAILRGTGALDVHVHEVDRQWGPEDRPLAETNWDPLLERDAVA